MLFLVDPVFVSLLASTPKLWRDVPFWLSSLYDQFSSIFDVWSHRSFCSVCVLPDLLMGDLILRIPFMHACMYWKPSSFFASVFVSFQASQQYIKSDLTALAGFYAGPLSLSNWYLETFLWREVNRRTRRRTFQVRRDPTTNSTHTYGTGPGSNPGHIVGRWVLSRLRHRCFATVFRDKPRGLVNKRKNTVHVVVWHVKTV